MIRSMTGFGDASEQVDGIHYSVELRSLNNRYFKAVIRLPEILMGLEAELESDLRQKLSRGSITLTAGFRDAGGQAVPGINQPAVEAYLKQIQQIQSRLTQTGHHQQQSVTVDLTALLSLPGVMESTNEGELQRKMRPVFKQMLDKAAEKLLTMRSVEGRAIAEDLRKQAKVIQVRLAEIKQRAPGVIDEYHQRLRTRVEELLRRAELSVNQVDLIREVAVFAERSDISEEIMRLGGHIEQMEAILCNSDGEPAGRTLDFLGQEMLREANTIASKSNDASISRAVVEIKSAIDRIKEQSANVE